jgi:alpha-galactosidase
MIRNVLSLKFIVSLAGIGLWLGLAPDIPLANAQAISTWASSAFSTSMQRNGPGKALPTGALLAPRRLPFSFTYGGKSSRDLLPAWKEQADAVIDTPAGTKQTVRWTDSKTGLIVAVEVTSFKNFPAVEWLLRFENTGAQDTPILEDVQALDLLLGTDDINRALELHRIAGSDASDKDFVPEDKTIALGTNEKFAPHGGRSSDSTFPFFTLRFDQDNLITAIGWTGQWAASIDRDKTGPTHLRAGMELTHLKLHPAESIRTPRILLFLKAGDRMDAQNLFRRFILADYAPRIDGQLPQAAIGGQSFNLVFGGRLANKWATEAGQIQAAHVNQQTGADTLWMDAGWMPGGFPKGAGNWFPRPEDFPRGLRPVGQACHQLGLRFLLWYEPERVASGTAIAREHPEFVLAGKTAGSDGLFNLGDPKARQWMTDLINSQIDEFGVDCYRQDFNMDPLPFWRANDAPDRQGITEIRHIEGLYAMWDEIRAKHPELYIDDCASGGRRIDLEMISRAIVQTRSDSEGEAGRADWEQGQTWGLSLYYPLHSSFTWDLTPYAFRSYATTGLLGEWDVLSPDFPVETVKQAFAEVKEDRKYFTGDYYPLTPWTRAADQWMAYQFHRPDLNAGIVLAFRHEQSPQGSLQAKLRGIDLDTNYLVTFIGDDYKEISRVMRGKDLSELELRLEKPHSSLLVRYKAQTKESSHK